MPTEREEGVAERTGTRLWLWLSLGLAVLSLLAGYLAGPGEDSDYLSLQEMSDPFHRLAVAVLPGCLLGLLLAWILRRMGLRILPRILAVPALPLFLGTLAYMIQFDRTIERVGIAGQFVMKTSPQASAGQVAGPFLEEPDGPGLTSPALPGGDRLVLDRRTLARRSPDGGYRWNRPRPGRHPAQLLVAGDTVLFAGPGPDYPDDVVVAAVDLDSGALRWTFHTLGNRIQAAIDGERLVLAASRPSVSTVTLIHWIVPTRLWSRRIDGSIAIRPRPEPHSVRVASGPRVIEINAVSGMVDRSDDACVPPGRPDVVCDRNRVVAWKEDQAGD